eukprot:5386742-Amphidinium_carterae.3
MQRGLTEEAYFRAACGALRSPCLKGALCDASVMAACEDRWSPELWKELDASLVHFRVLLKSHCDLIYGKRSDSWK